MEPFLLFSTAFAVGLSGALMPGPLTAVMVEHTLKKGFIAAPLITLGHGIIEALMVVLLAAGLSGYMAGRGPAGVIGVIGGAVLAWMGGGMVKSARSGALSLRGEPKERKRLSAGPLAAGIATTVANPYWFLWWATVGAGFVTVSREYGPGGVFLFFGGHILADLVWLSLLASALVYGKNYISDRVYRSIVAALGFFLMALSLYFLWTGIRYLLPA